ncbi:nucleotidyl transferase AbiEii/AbiGii toxin family protein [Psychromarinibacter halotolerans]|uniref:Nucleotidyl transferase AbiEii/AbiGii toxin family protein n=1 Tax=Psychromarinibacter halotolerans TaxID=1775175 RepID=A0ABV7GIQ5_9RHOB|nr:nucleotidyl transferase AbiEii/AbiGii toxin family protein [Psychromarinibacter halotolerans]MDF0598760.1 nucleotidyl transferase AbiEii/AbiGii toxin family protein [Psychromarinibacter halotolerans]
MAEAFLRLSGKDRLDALGVAADRLGRPAHLLEKDVWVVWAIQQLFGSPIGTNLVFKGGTSLSKAYQVIDRFSEDVDLTFDIRALIPDLLGGREDAMPATSSEERRWSKRVRQALPEWVAGTVQPILQQAMDREGIDAGLRIDGDKLFIDYPHLAQGTGYVSPSVMLEFGARSTGEPASPRDIVCDAASVIEGVEFPTARPRVMHAERTFWEKATAIHVFCLQNRMRGDRFSRHWHDVARLDDAGIAAAAIEDRALATAVARHKTMFFAEKAADATWIDYGTATSGHLQLVPGGDALKALADDYGRMVEDGLLASTPEPFGDLMDRCAGIARRANAAFKPD